MLKRLGVAQQLDKQTDGRTYRMVVSDNAVKCHFDTWNAFLPTSSYTGVTNFKNGLVFTGPPCTVDGDWCWFHTCPLGVSGSCVQLVHYIRVSSVGLRRPRHVVGIIVNAI